MAVGGAPVSLSLDTWSPDPAGQDLGRSSGLLQLQTKRGSGLSCRWLVQNGEWAFLAVTGPLFILTFFSLVSLNFSDPGILHRGEDSAPPGRSWHSISGLAPQDFFTPGQHFSTLAFHFLSHQGIENKTRQDPGCFPVASEEWATQAGERSQ